MSELRCQPGDLAIITGPPKCLYVGRMVTCHQIVTEARIGTTLGPLWRIDKVIEWRDAKSRKTYRIPAYPDQYLLPIRPDPCEDPVPEPTFTYQPAKVGV